MELAIINGTYRDGSKIQQKINQIIIPNNSAQSVSVSNSNGLRSPPNLGQSLILSPRLAAAANNSQIISNSSSQHHSIFTAPTDPSTSLIYTTLPTIYSDHHVQAINTQTLLDYPNGIEFSQTGKYKKSNMNNLLFVINSLNLYFQILFL
jgi:hypothetical protein